MYIYREIYFKELAHLIIVADKSAGQVGSWRIRRANGIVPFRGLAGSRPRKSHCFSLSPNARKS